MGSVAPSPYQNVPAVIPDFIAGPGTLAIGQNSNPWSKLSSLLGTQINAPDYINQRQRLTGEDVLSPEEAAQLNEAYADLGIPMPAYKGSTDWRKPASIKTDALSSYLLGGYK